MSAPLFTHHAVCIPAVEIPDLVTGLQEHLLPGLQAGVYQACEGYRTSEGLGADELSFGLTAWSYPNRLFLDACEDGRIPLRKERYHGPLLGFGAFQVFHHRVARHASDDIHQSFPLRAKGLRQEWDHQQQLLFACQLDPSVPRPVVLAYAANPHDGLGWVYLTTVGNVYRNRVRSWDQVIPIWTPDSGIPQVPPQTPDLPPPETSPVPTLRRRRKTRVDEG